MRQPQAVESPAEIFHRLDTDGNGRIDVRELQRALSDGRFLYDLHTTQALARLFSSGLGDTSLSLAEFILLHKWLETVMARFNAALEPGRTTLPQAAARAALTALLADECTRLGVNRQLYTVDNRAFDAFLDAADADAGSSQDASEFVRAAVALRGLITVFKAFDVDKDGKVNLTFSQMLYVVSHVI